MEMKNEKVIKRVNNVLPSAAFGKIPPQAKEIEVVILGAIMIENKAFEVVSEILNPESFYVDTHRLIFEAMVDLAQQRLPIDMLTVIEQLKKTEKLDLVGGPYYIAQLTKGVVSSANIETHSRIVLQKFLQREIIRIGSEMVKSGFDETNDVFDLLDEVESSVFGLTLNYLKRDYKHISDGMKNVVNRIEYLKTVDGTITGVPSTFPTLDGVTHGWQNTDLIILAARPSVGKTAFSLNLARNAALNREKPTAVGYFSLEMSQEQLISRMLAAESNVWLKSIKTGKLSASDSKTLYQKGVDPLSSAPVFIDDTASLNVFELRAKARRMKSKHGVGLIIIDYLQLMTGDKKTNNREQEISKISRELKGLAKTLNIPIIALSQLSREVEKRGRGNKMPVLSDLRESGAIEQDADMVMFLYRPSPDEIKEDAELGNKGSLGIAKNRHGELIEIAFRVDNSIQKWEEHREIESGAWKPVSEIKNFYEVDKEDLPF